MTEAATTERAITEYGSFGDIVGVDVRGCQVFEIQVALYAEYETAGHRPETWPAPVRAMMERQVEAWVTRNPTRVIRMVSFAAPAGNGKQNCIAVLHHAPKG